MRSVSYIMYHFSFTVNCFC